MEGYSDLPDKEEMMAEMRRLKKAQKSQNSKSLKNRNLIIGNGGQITGQEGEKGEGGSGAEGGEGGGDKEEEEGISEVARSMGRETIDMLSQAKMR